MLHTAILLILSSPHTFSQTSCSHFSDEHVLLWIQNGKHIPHGNYRNSIKITFSIRINNTRTVLQALLFILHLVMKMSIIQFKWICHIISSLLLQNTEESKHLISELRSSFPLSVQVLVHIEELGQLVDAVAADTASQKGLFSSCCVWQEEHILSCHMWSLLKLSILFLPQG